ncbi:hypothetical protein [Methylobacterium nodulans]|uniref:hypothetical protein n=1 Tax=Methylobacterium nodulans TaxID=114616 RepID=UPI0001617AF0|nr:hypothetical protein [Methylobacterium nodulans]
MTALELAGLLKDYGPWGLLALALLAVSYLQRRSDALRLSAGRLAPCSTIA